MYRRSAVISVFAALVGYTDLIGGQSSSTHHVDSARVSVSQPLPPEYVIGPGGSVTLRVCFNWSCSITETMTFTASDMARIKRLMATCSGKSFHDRLQQVRIGIWQMELLAQTYQPLLANDLAINDLDAALMGRMDCVDNSSNTTTYLNILRDIGELPGWMVSLPKVRRRFDITAVHWTAVIIDRETGRPWSVDSWYRPNGHLPMVMPLQGWVGEKKAWEPPFARLNPTPHSIGELCGTPR